MAGIIINILLNKKIKNKQELFSILNHCLLEKDIHFLNASVYRPEQEDSENINSIEEWLDISYKNGYMNQSEFLCEGNNIRVYSVKINEKMGLEIYIPYDFINELYSLEEKNIEFLKRQMLDLMKSNIIDYLFVDFDETLELSLLDFKHKMMNEVCYYILAIIKDGDKLLEFSSGEIL